MKKRGVPRMPVARGENPAEGVVPVSDYYGGGNKCYPMLEKEAWERLQRRLPQDGKVLNYREAVQVLCNLRVNRKRALKLLKIFEEEGLLERRAGHGVRLAKMEGDENE